MPITLACPACSKKLQVKDELAGKRVKCPACAKVVDVPAQRNETPKRLPVAASPRPERRTLWPWIISAVSALLLAVVATMWLLSDASPRGNAGTKATAGEPATKAELASLRAEAEQAKRDLAKVKADFANAKTALDAARAESETLKADLGKAKAEAEAAKTKLAQAQPGAKPSPPADKAPPPATNTADPAKAAKTDHDLLQGTWTVKSPPVVKGLRVVIKGDQFTTFNGDKKLAEMTYSVDPAKDPKVIEMRQGGKVIGKGTYVLDKDMLLLNMVGEEEMRLQRHNEVDQASKKEDGFVPADYVGKWTDKQKNILSIDAKKLSTCGIKFPGVGIVAAAFRPEVKGKEVFLQLGIGTENTRWKLTLGKDKKTLMMEMVEGETKRDKLIFTKEPPTVTDQTGDWPFARGTAEGTGVVAHAGPTVKPVIAWTFKSAGPDPAGAMGSMSCTPVVREGIVYWGSDDGVLYALRAANGEKVWKHGVNKKPKTGGQVLGSAAVSDKHVFVSFFGKGIVCLERTSGKPLWRKQFVLTVSSPVVVKGKVLFGHSNGLTCYDDTGNEVFTYRPPNGVTGIKGAVFGVITAGQAQVCFGSDNGRVYALGLEAGAKQWESSLDLFPVRSAAAIAKDQVLICARDTLLCLDLKSGRSKGLWTRKFDKDDFLTSPAVGKDYIIVATSKGKVYRVNRKDGQPQWTHDEKEAGAQAPIVGKDLVYLAVKRKLVALELATGRKKWECELPAEAAAAPALAGGMLLVSARDGALYALGAKKAASTSAPAPAPQDPSDWKKDWRAFIGVLAPMLKRGASNAEFKKQFGGQQVTWTGRITEISFKPKSNIVRLKMPITTVTLSSGAKAEVPFVLVPKESNLKKWRDARVGDTVQFRTTLKGSLPPYVVVVFARPGGPKRNIVIIATEDAELLQVVKPKREELGPATGIPFERIREFRSGRMVEQEGGKDRVFLVVRAKVPVGKVKPYTDFELTEAGKRKCYCCGVATSERDLLGSFQDFYPTDEVALVGGGRTGTIIVCFALPRAYKTPVMLHFRGKESAVKIITELDFEVECLSHADEKTREKAALYLGSRVKEKEVALRALKKALASEKSRAVKEQITKSIGRLEEHDAKAKQAATLKVEKGVPGKGEMTIRLTVEWAKGVAQPKPDEVTVVFLFQDRKKPVLMLDTTLLGKLGTAYVAGLSENGCVWVLRRAVGGEKKKTVDVLQMVGSDKKAASDFRKDGEHTLKVQLSGLPTERVYVGLFQETDPMKWQQSSTSYKRLSNVVELSPADDKPPAVKVAENVIVFRTTVGGKPVAWFSVDGAQYQYEIDLNMTLPKAAELKNALLTTLSRDKKHRDKIVFSPFTPSDKRPGPVEVAIGKSVPMKVIQDILRELVHLLEMKVVLSIRDADGQFLDTRRVYIGALLKSGKQPIAAAQLKSFLDPKLTRAEFIDKIQKKTSQKTSPSPRRWQSDFEAFGKAVQSAAKDGKNLEALFTHKEVKWVVTVERVEKTALRFKEAQPYAKGEPALDIWATLEKTEVKKAEKLKRGEKVTVKGKIGFVVVMESDKGKVILIGPQGSVIEAAPK